MLGTSIVTDTPSVKKITLEYDKFIPREVLGAIRYYYPEIEVSDYTPELIVSFIPDDACAKSWLPLLRSAASPKPKKRRTSRRKPSPKCNHAAAVIGQDRAMQVAL